MRLLDKDILACRIDSSVKCDIAENRICGAALYVSQAGETLYKKGIGSADPIKNIPVTDKTIFRIASMTKPITAVAALQLVDRGLLSLDDPVAKFFPAFQNMRIAAIDDQGKLTDAGPAKNPVTIKNILTHTSGIGSGNVGGLQIGAMTAADRATLANTIAYFSEQGLQFEPSTKRVYSGFPSFDVLTGIIEKVADEDYQDYITREILAPCDMVDTTFTPSDEQWKRVATMHDRVDGKSCVGKMNDGCIFEDIPCTHYLGGAGLVSTLHDYINFSEMLLHNGNFAGHQIVSAEAIQKMSTQQIPRELCPGFSSWGLSVRVIVAEERHNLPIGAYGWSGHYGPHFWIDPKNQIVAIYMKNSLYDPGSGPLTGINFEADVYHSFKCE